MADGAGRARVRRALIRWGYEPAAGALTVAALLFAGIFALRLAVDAPREAVGVLFAVPIALLAIRFGPWGGVGAAVVGLALIAISEIGHDAMLGALGWFSRATVFGLLGVLLGWYAQRLRTLQAAQRRLVSAAPDPIVDLDAAGRIVAVNPEAERLLDTPAPSLVGHSVADVLPEHLHRHRDAALRFLSAPGFQSLRDVEGLAVVGSNGRQTGVEVTLMPRLSAQGAVVRAVMRDVSAQRQASEALRHTAALLGAAEEIGGMGSWEWDLRTGRQRWSDELYRLFGLEPQSLEPTFDAFLAAVHPDDRDVVTTAGRDALEAATASTNEFRIVRPDGEILTVEGLGRVVTDAAGQVTGMIGTTRDITERKRAEARLARAAGERARTGQTRQLLQITDAALASLPLDELLDQLLARICTALPADSAALLLVEPPGEELVLRATHGIGSLDPATALARGQGLAARVAQARRAIAVTGDDVAEVRLTPLREMGAVAAAPLLVGPRVLGVLEVGRRDPAPLGDDELALLQLAADRSALAIDHGRVFERERHIAHTLQQSLLPEELPAIPGVALEARFLPAGEGQEVGGDFYDAFQLSPGRWLLVIGDVCGKGPEAAALTALVRYTLRAEAMHDPRPGELLGLLNDAILAHRPSLRFCTALCLLLELEDGRARITVASGGHPMPLILRADGAVETPSAAGGGPLVGVLEEADYGHQICLLHPGDTLVAYTDGLLDAHAPERILGADDIAAIGRTLPKRPLATFVRRLEDAAIGAVATPVRDDIAILSLALDHAPDRSGPGDAGEDTPAAGPPPGD
ncbi:MAG TPA: SpoIIE family protein phosphatase [Solirubrobacteraceae bacterium]|nr:SpoIIE family protein phosphatase [Solirubrobacteraceae bacterium]